MKFCTVDLFIKSTGFCFTFCKGFISSQNEMVNLLYSAHLHNTCLTRVYLEINGAMFYFLSLLKCRHMYMKGSAAKTGKF